MQHQASAAQRGPAAEGTVLCANPARRIPSSEMSGPLYCRAMRYLSNAAQQLSLVHKKVQRRAGGQPLFSQCSNGGQGCQITHLRGHGGSHAHERWGAAAGTGSRA